MFFKSMAVIWVIGYFLLNGMAKYADSWERQDIINWITIGWFFIPIILLIIYYRFFDKRNKKTYKG